MTALATQSQKRKPWLPVSAPPRNSPRFLVLALSPSRRTKKINVVKVVTKGTVAGIETTPIAAGIAGAAAVMNAAASDAGVADQGAILGLAAARVVTRGPAVLVVVPVAVEIRGRWAQAATRGPVAAWAVLLAVALVVQGLADRASVAADQAAP